MYPCILHAPFSAQQVLMGCATSKGIKKNSNVLDDVDKNPSNKASKINQYYEADFRPSITKFLRNSPGEIDRLRASLELLCNITGSDAAFIACRHSTGVAVNVTHRCQPIDVDDLIPKTRAESMPNYRTSYTADITYDEMSPQLTAVSENYQGGADESQYRAQKMSQRPFSQDVLNVNEQSERNLMPLLVVPMQDKFYRTVGYLVMCGISTDKLLHNCTYNLAQLIGRDVENRTDIDLANVSEAIVLLDTTLPSWGCIWSSYKWQSLMQKDVGISTQFWDILRDDKSITPTGPYLMRMPEGILKTLSSGNITTVSLVPRVDTSKTGHSIVYTVAFERLCDARYLVQPSAQSIQDVDSHTYYASIVIAKICAVVNDTFINSNSASQDTTSLSVGADQDTLSALQSDVSLGKLLGKGGYGSVYSAVWEGREIALKIQEEPYNEADSIFSHDYNPEKKTMSEFEVAKHLEHPNVVRTYRSETHKSDDRLQTWIFMELCSNGSLRQVMERGFFKNSDGPNMTPIMQCLSDIAAGMTYLHEKEILHGDLSSNNVLFDQHWRAKISDFGLSRTFMGGTCETQTYGTVSVMPQELLSQGILSRKSDVYAFGVLMFEIYTSTKAWHGMRHAQIISAKLKPTERLIYPPGSDADYVKLTENCMAFSYHERPDFCTVLQVLQQWMAVIAP